MQERREQPVRSRLLAGAGGLILLNAALLAVLALVTFSPAATGNTQPRGDYMMVGGQVPGYDGAAVYIVDTINQDMVVVAYSQSSRDLHPVAYRNIAADIAELARGQRPSR